MDGRTKKVSPYAILNPKVLIVQFTQDDHKPYLFEELDPATGVPLMSPVIWGLTFSFQLTWLGVARSFIHNFTITEHYDNSLHVYQHSFSRRDDFIQLQGEKGRKITNSKVSITAEPCTCSVHQCILQSHRQGEVICNINTCVCDQQRSCPKPVWPAFQCETAPDDPNTCICSDCDPKLLSSTHPMCFKDSPGLEGVSSPEDSVNKNIDEGHTNLSVLSYNIWNTNSVEGKDTSYVKRIKQLAKFCRSSRADIIGFQEVRFEVGRGGQLGPNQVQHLATMLPEYQFVFQPAQIQTSMLPERVEEGVAIFSRFPIVSSHTILLTRNPRDAGDGHQRVLLHATILVDKIGLVHALTTHLSLSHVARQRTLIEVWKYIKAIKGPVFFVGDFNAEGHNDEIRFLSGKTSLRGQSTSGLVDVWEAVNGPQEISQGFTFSTLDRQLSKRIDFIYMTKHPHVHIHNITLYDDKKRKAKASSDHIGLLATFLLKKV